MAPFYGSGSTASSIESHYEETVYLFTSKFRGVLGTHFIDIERMKADSTLEPPTGFLLRTT